MATDLSLETEIVQSKINIFLEKNSKSIITGILVLGAVILAIAFLRESKNQALTTVEEELSVSIAAGNTDELNAWISAHADKYPDVAFGAYLKLAEIKWDTDPKASIESLTNLLAQYSGEQSDIILASLASKLIELGSEEQIQQAQQLLESNQNTSYLTAYLQTILGDTYWKQGNQEKAFAIWEQTTQQFTKLDPKTGEEIIDPFSLAAQNRIDWADFQSPEIIEAPANPTPVVAPTLPAAQEVDPAS